MSVMSDKEILDALEKGELVISEFDKKLLQSASYDLRLGRRVLKSTTDGESPIVDLEKERVLQIGTGEFVEVITLEKLELPSNICGRIGIRSYFTRKGLIFFSGPQVDPGFKGHLVISLFNTGPRPIIMKYGEPFCTIEFCKTGKAVEKPYEGPYQNQTDFPTENIEFIMGAKGITLYEVSELMKKLSHDVKWMKYLLGFIFAALLSQLILRIFGL